MAYACPVCGDPQADAVHLANHLAFTAMTSGADHEGWLDEHVPGWGQLGEEELAAEVTEHAESTDLQGAFDVAGSDDEESEDESSPDGDGTDGRSPEDDARDAAGADRDGGAAVDPSAAADPAPVDDDELAAVLEEARELTRRQLADDDGTDAQSDNETE